MIFSYEEWLADLEAVPAKEQAEFIRLSLRGKHMLHIFARYFFPEEITEGEDTPAFHQELIGERAKPGNSAIIEPRGHAKTTIARIDTIHDVVYELEPFVVFCGPTMTDAKDSLGYVKTQLETNELLRTVYGDLVPPPDPKRRRKWSDAHIEPTNGVILIARGAGKGRGLNIKGKRPTKIVIDDMEKDEHIQSEIYRRKLERWLYRVIVPALDPKRGKFKMIGTVFHYDALILKVLAKYGGIRRAALEKRGKADMDGDPVWPARFSKDKLKKVREEIGTFGFAQEYMNDPMTDENADVKLVWIRRVESVRLFDDHDKPLATFYSALDPAISQKQTADDAALCTVARMAQPHADGRMRLVVLSGESGKWGSSGTITRSKRVWERYPHAKFGVETVAFQEIMRQLLQANGVGASAITRGSADKRTRLLAIIGLIEFGNVEFMPGCEDLITQLVQFPNGDHDDLVDAFVDAVTMAKGGGSGVYFGTL
jgi:predicted phage terminase large subunit-like protein